jgi:hypothetical protein
MSLLMGGGSLTLSTDRFENGEPTGLQVRDFLSTPVLDPIPVPPFESNNVQSINFFSTPASGFTLTNNLPTISKNIFMSGSGAQLRVLQSRLTIRTSQGTWITIQPFVRTTQGWNQLPVRIWTGTVWHDN